MWTDKMKSFLEYLYSGTPTEGNKQQKKADRTFITDMKWKGTMNTVRWEFKPSKDFIPDMYTKGNFSNMITRFSLTNMHVLDENGYPRRYTSPEDLILDFCTKRLAFYDKRKQYWLKQWSQDLLKAECKYKYIVAVNDGSLDMQQEENLLEENMINIELVKIDDSFDYLLSMQMRSMTPKRLAELEAEAERIRIKVEDLASKSSVDLWKIDLVDFRAAWKTFLKTRREE